MVSSVLSMGKPAQTNQIHMTLRPKYGEHQVQHSTQDIKSNLLRMTLRPTEMRGLEGPSWVFWTQNGNGNPHIFHGGST